MAIVLDTSGSMDGLINQARAQIWKIVNELARAKKDGKSPQLEVALFEYGNDGLPADEGFIRNLTPLTNDLDKVSESLFQLTTNGGEEYCGQVIGAAVNRLNWSKNSQDYKVLIIAGNEPFTQGVVDYRESCRRAIARGIVINTIFCGNYQEGLQTHWKDGADLADGSYLAIDQDQTAVQINAPQDAEIMKLGAALNETYVGYGSLGDEKKGKQVKEDYNAVGMGRESAVQRSMAKASVAYENSTWDLVDLVKKDGLDAVDKINKADLPPKLQKMTKDQLKKYLQTKLKARETIQNRLAKLNEARRVYIEKEMKAQLGRNTLDAAIIKAIRQQAGQKKFKF